MILACSVGIKLSRFLIKKEKEKEDSHTYL